MAFPRNGVNTPYLFIENVATVMGMESSENADSLDSLKLRRGQMLAQFVLRTKSNLDWSDLRERLLRVDSLIAQAERGEGFPRLVSAANP